VACETVKRTGAASPAPSRGRSGSAAQDPADNGGRPQRNDPSWRELGPPTGVPTSVKEELAAFYAAHRVGIVHRLPGQEGLPVEEAGTGTWG
jgi:hypothetical protein